MVLKLGLPKGSLQESTFNIFKKAGFDIKADSRSYYPGVDDEKLKITLVRAQEMAMYVAEGIFDAGLTGEDWVEESGKSVRKVANLVYGKVGMRPVRWVLAVPENSKIHGVKDLKGKRISTELVNTTKKWLKKRGVTGTKVEFSWGATEAKPPHLADAIVELTETGSSLRANKLRIVDTVLESTTVMIANKEAWKDQAKKKKIENILLLLKGALNAEDKVGLKLNVREKDLAGILEILPALKRPTISMLIGMKGWAAIEVAIDEKIVRELIPRLIENGAEDIIEYPLNKVIY
ncbi:MAG TPA: ATP phosphoribosyltransferase [Firmicutes bacterium]|nr:ATP phosphoribosyltransferase [Bacillota bacterium]